MSSIEFIKISSFEIGALMLASSCMIYTIFRRGISKPHSTIFLMILSSLMASAICNMACTFIRPFCADYKAAPVFLELFDTLYFVAHTLIAWFLCYYAVFATESFLRLDIKAHAFLMTPIIVAEFFTVTNPFTHWLFYYTDNYVFNRGWAEAFVYFAGIFYLLATMYFFMFRWFASTKKKRRLIVVSFIITIIGITIQLLFEFMDVELLAETITLMGIMLAIEYDDDSIDGLTRVYNRQALIADLNTFFSCGKHFVITVVSVVEDDWHQTYDLDNYMMDLAEHLRSAYKLRRVYRASLDAFVIIGYLGEEKNYIPGLTAYVRKKNTALKTLILTADAPTEIAKLDDALLMIDGEKPNADNGTILKGKDLDFLERSFEINRALEKAIENNGFQVFYQPIYEKDQNGEWVAKGVEALVRLHDEKLGNLLPDDFIPSAERNGYIGALGEFVLRDVLSFIESGELSEAGIDYVTINLSEVQCMKTDFADRICAIAGSYMADPERIRFEMGEEFLNEVNPQVPEIIRKLKNFGFSFVLEGFGAGYGGVDPDFTGPFDVVKIDKSLLWNSDRKKNGKIILENCIRIIHGQGKKIVAIGVETGEQLEYLDKCGVEAVQGFYFSKAVSRDILASQLK